VTIQTAPLSYNSDGNPFLQKTYYGFTKKVTKMIGYVENICERQRTFPTVCTDLITKISHSLMQYTRKIITPVKEYSKSQRSISVRRDVQLRLHEHH
jgi:hypothetical protein